MDTIMEIMRRRNFLNIAGAWATTRLLPSPGDTTAKRLIKPKPLQKGDVVGLVTPGFPAGDESFQKAVDNIRNLGLVPKYSEKVNGRYGYLAGTDAERAEDLMKMFRDPEIKGIWCVRGGYGCTRILPALDYRVIRQNPKVLIGYSDITALHLALYRNAGLITFHGPVGTSDFTPYTLEQVQKMVMPADNAAISIPLSEANEEEGKTRDIFRYQVLHPGRATGRLFGGNLSLVSALAGTPYLPSFRDSLVYLEDIGEKPYRLDRMLVQLLQSTDIDRAAGLILGIFEDCEPSDAETDFTVFQLIQDHLLPLGIPVMYGFSFGHIDNQCTFPVGVEATMDTGLRTVQLSGSPVSF